MFEKTEATENEEDTTTKSDISPTTPLFLVIIRYQEVPEPTATGAETRRHEPEGPQRIQPPKARADVLGQKDDSELLARLLPRC